MRRLLTIACLLLAAPVWAQIQPSGIGPGITAPIFGLPSSLVNGSGTFTPQLFGPESCTVPAYSFTGATTSGYGSSSGNPCIVVSGTQRLGVSATAVTSTVSYLGPDGSASAPSFSFTSDPNTGWYSPGADALAAALGGLVGPYFSQNQSKLNSSQVFGWADTGNAATGTLDVILLRDAANVLAQRNSTTAQTFRLYNTFTDASNYERFEIINSATTTELVTKIAGTGTANALRFGVVDSQWQISTSGHWLAVTDNTYDIGATGATRPKDYWGGGKGTFGSTVTTGAGTTAIAPLVVTNGTNLTAAAANAIENDGTAFYQTIDTTNGRTYNDGWNYFRLTGSGTGITTIADFFGANSAIPMVASGVYEVEWNAYFSQVTAGTATWTVTTATTALANLTGEYMCSNIAGIGAVGAPQTAAINVTSSSATAFPVTGTEATGVTHYCRVRAMMTAGAGASNTRLRLTMSAGTATPLINSYFRVRRLPAGNTGTFVP